MFVVGLRFVNVLSSLLVQCSWLHGRTHLWIDLLCVELDVKPC